MSALSSLLVQDQIVSVSTIEEALQRQVIFGGQLDTNLLELRAVDEGVVVEYKSRVSHLAPALPKEFETVGADALGALPRAVAESSGLMPLRRDGSKLRVAICRPPAEIDLEEVAAAVSLTLEPVMTSELRLRVALNRYYGVDLPARFDRLSPVLDSASIPSVPAASSRPASRFPSKPPGARAERRPERPSVPAVAVTPVAEHRPAVTPAEPPESGEAAEAKFDIRDTFPGMTLPTTGHQPGTSILPLPAGLELIEQASSREEVFDAALRVIGGMVEYAAVFVVKGRAALGKASWGAGTPAEELARRPVLLEKPGALWTVTETRAHYLGPLPPGRSNDSLLGAIGRSRPTTVLVVPVVIRDRAVVLIYADSGARAAMGYELAALLPLASAMGATFERLIIERKRTSTMPEPPPEDDEPAPEPTRPTASSYSPPQPSSLPSYSPPKTELREEKAEAAAVEEPSRPDNAEAGQGASPLPRSTRPTPVPFRERRGTGSPDPTGTRTGDGVLILLTEVLGDPQRRVWETPTAPVEPQRPAEPPVDDHPTAQDVLVSPWDRSSSAVVPPARQAQVVTSDELQTETDERPRLPWEEAEAAPEPSPAEPTIDDHPPSPEPEVNEGEVSDWSKTDKTSVTAGRAERDQALRAAAVLAEAPGGVVGVSDVLLISGEPEEQAAATEEQAAATEEQAAATEEQAAATEEQAAATEEQAAATEEKAAAAEPVEAPLAPKGLPDPECLDSAVEPASVEFLPGPEFLEALMERGNEEVRLERSEIKTPAPVEIVKIDEREASPSPTPLEAALSSTAAAQPDESDGEEPAEAEPSVIVEEAEDDDIVEVTLALPGSDERMSALPDHASASGETQVRPAVTGAEMPVSGLPSVIVDMGEDIEGLVERALGEGVRGDEAADELVDAGEVVLPALIRRFPGEVLLDFETLSLPVPEPARHGRLMAILQRFGSTAIPYLIPCLNSADRAKRFYATLLLGELDEIEALDAVGLRLLDFDVRVASLALSLIRRVVPLRQLSLPVYRAVRLALDDTRVRPVTVRRAVEAVGVLRDPGAVPHLIELLKSQKGPLRQSVVSSLRLISCQDFGNSARRWSTWWSRVRNQERAEWLLKALDHRQEAIRARAANELKLLAPGDFGYSPAAPRRERESARQRYLQWWEDEGRQQLSQRD